MLNKRGQPRQPGSSSSSCEQLNKESLCGEGSCITHCKTTSVQGQTRLMRLLLSGKTTRVNSC
jgi:hypothetical protein